MGIDRAGLMRLCTSYHDAVFPPLYDMKEQIRVVLLVRRFRAIALGIRHSTVHRQVFFLYHFQEFHKSIVIGCSVFFIYFKSGRIDSVKSVHTDTPLKTAGRLLSQQPLHLHLFYQIVAALMEMSKPVDGLSCDIGFRCHDFFVFRVLCQGIGHGYTVDGRSDNGMIHPVVNFLTKQINPRIQFSQTLNIFCCCH